MVKKKYILKITPQTNVRATQGDRIFFRIPREKLRPAGLSRLLRLEKYNDYKSSLSALVKQQRFTIPEQNVHMIFYIPVPKTWKEYKKNEMHMKLHQQKPDIDNLVKAVFDSIFSEDKYIADFRATKRWVNQPEGYIEFLIELPEFPSKDVLI
jgi:Holliday junction resolvase RusA-like endonuclease